MSVLDSKVWSSFFRLGPLAALAGAVIGVASLILDGVHAAIEDSEAQLLLKSSFWGTKSYKYVISLSNSTLEERRKYFQTEDVTQEILDAIKKEYVAFFDYLYKPQGNRMNTPSGRIVVTVKI